MYKFLFLLVVFTVNQPAHAMTWSELKNEIDNVERSGRSDQAVVMRFSEIVQTMVVIANLQAEKDPSTLLYCPPRDKSFNLDQLVSILRSYARSHEASDTASVQHLLIQSLIEEFPCPSSSG